MIYDNGWFRVMGLSRNGKKHAHYFFNDKPIHSLKTGLFKEEADYSKRYSSNDKKCKKCLTILTAYLKIGLENRLT